MSRQGRVHILTTAQELHLFQQHAARFQVFLKEQHLDLFKVYLEELWVWNKQVNITGAATRQEVWMNLFLDSLIPGPHLPEAGNLLDVGSGGGFPGIPLKIYRSGLSIDLLEVNSKRVSFLKHIIRLLRLGDIRVVRGRIDKSGTFSDKGKYDIVTARAVASPLQTLLWCAPLLETGGMLVLFLGSDTEKGLIPCREALNRYSMTIEKSIPYLLPGKKTLRSSVIIKKMTTSH